MFGYNSAGRGDGFGLALGLMAALLSTTALAQQPNSSLPPVTVDPPVQRRATPRAVQPSVRPAPARVATRRAQPTARPAPVRAVRAPVVAPARALPAEPVEIARGPVGGMVAKRTGTATKTDTPILETPQSVSVIPREQMEQQGAESVSQALRYSAGVISEYRPTNNRYDSVFIRGFSGGGTAAPYVNFWDGLRMVRGQNYLVPTVDPYSLERVEILRGPASVLFGQVNIGGMVNLVSKRPSEVPFREIQVQVGSYNRIQTAFDLSGPADPEGKLLYRLTGLFRDANTQVDYTGEQRIMIAPSFTWKPDESIKLTVYGHYQRDPETGFYGVVPAVGSVLPNRYGARIPTSFFPGEPRFEGFHRNQAHVGYEFETKPVEGVTLRQNLRYVDMDSKFRTVVAAGLAADQATLNRRITSSREFARGLTLDNQAQFDFSTGPLRHKVLVGMDYLNVDSDSNTGVSTNVASINFLNPVYGRAPFVPGATPRGQQDQQQLGIYLQDQIKFDRLVVTGGVRHDWAETRSFDYGTRQRIKATDQATTGRVGLAYLFDSGITPYASYATSFDPLTTGVSFDRTPFKPTTGEQFEAGVKYQPVGYNAFIQASAFDLTQNNVTTADPRNVLFQIQTGQIRSRGVEVEARATLAKSLDLIASYTALDIEVTKANNAALGNRPVASPAHMASGWAYYTFQDGPLAGLGFGGGVRYIGNSLGTFDGVFRVPSYTLYDAAVSYDLGRGVPALKGLKLSVNAYNLADKIHVASCFAAAQCYYGNRRTVLGTLTYRW